jgi:hypothetical protein
VGAAPESVQPRPEVVARVDEILPAMDADHAEFDRLMDKPA